jgi:hypothetical protein
MEKPSLTLLCTPSQKQTERCHPLEQIGNAVPLELSRRLGVSLIELLDKF